MNSPLYREYCKQKISQESYSSEENIKMYSDSNSRRKDGYATQDDDTFSNIQTLLENEKSELLPPDGGWGWMVLFGGFLTLVLTNLPLSGFGIIFAPLFAKTGASSTNIAWIFNVHAFIWNISVLMVGPLCEEFGWRKVAIVGGIFNSVSVFLSGFSPGFEVLFLTHSILGAIGGSIGTAVSMFVVSRYFVKHRGFALGIMTLGVCCGSFISPLLLNYLLHEYGFRWASVVFGALMMNQCVAGALFHPVKWHMKREKNTIPEDSRNGSFENNLSYNDVNDKTCQFERQKERARNLRLYRTRTLSDSSLHYSVGSIGQSTADLAIMASSDNLNVITLPKTKQGQAFIRILKSTYNNIKSLKSMRVSMIAIAAAGMMLGYMNFQMWIPFAVRDGGHSLEMSAWALAISAVANTLSRITTSFISDCPRFNIIFGYMIGLLFTTASIIAFPTSTHLYHMFVCVGIWGFSIGIVMTLYPTVMIKVMGLDMFPAVFGVSSLFIALLFIIIGPITGLIRDMTNSYQFCLWMIAGMVFIAFLLWLLMPLGKKYDLKNINKDQVQVKNETQ